VAACVTLAYHWSCHEPYDYGAALSAGCMLPCSGACASTLANGSSPAGTPTPVRRRRLLRSAHPPPALQQAVARRLAEAACNPSPGISSRVEHDFAFAFASIRRPKITVVMYPPEPTSPICACGRPFGPWSPCRNIFLSMYTFQGRDTIGRAALQNSCTFATISDSAHHAWVRAVCSVLLYIERVCMSTVFELLSFLVSYSSITIIFAIE
jgi:hypothetical protein